MRSFAGKFSWWQQVCTFLDDHSKKVVVYFLKAKSKVFYSGDLVINETIFQNTARKRSVEIFFPVCDDGNAAEDIRLEEEPELEIEVEKPGIKSRR